MNAFIAVIRDITLLLVRLGLGGIMIWHGLTRWLFTTEGVPRYTDYLSQFSVPYPIYVGWGVTILELVGGIFLVLGALTPLVALLALAQQVLTISYTNYWRGPDLLAPDGSYAGGWEYNVMLALLALVLLCFGPGRVAIDRLFRRPKSTEVVDDDPTTSPSSNNTSSMASASTW